MNRALWVAGILICCILGDLPAEAQQYPVKPITFIAPFGVGGMGDITGRIVAKALERQLGQPMVFLNKPGGFAAIGLSEIAKAKADGYTLGNVDDGALIMTPLQRQVTYSLKDFIVIGGYVKQEMLLYSRPGAPWKNVKELFEYSKQTPVTVGSSGDWEQMITKVIAEREGLKWRFVATKSGGENSVMLLGGHIDLCTAGVGTPVDLAARAGKVGMTLIYTRDRLSEYPDLKNVVDLGYDFYQILRRYLLVPAGAPESIVRRLEGALEKAAHDPEFVGSIKKLGIAPAFLNSAESRQELEDGSKAVGNLLSAYGKIKQP